MKKIVTILSCALISCSIKAQINSSTFGMMEARHLGPGTMSGRITDIAGVNADGKTFILEMEGEGNGKRTKADGS